MIKIISIAQGKKQGVFKIEFDNGEALFVVEDVLVKYRLTKERELTEEEFLEIQQENQLQKGLNLALRYIDFQMRSILETDQYLREKEIDEPSRIAILERLQEMKWLDDLNYAKSFVRTKKRVSDKGVYHLSYQLKQKGVKSELIEEALLEFSEEEQHELALKVAGSLAKQYRKRSYREALQKIRLGLNNKGFTSQDIQFAFEHLEFEKDEEAEWTLLLRECEKLWHKFRNFDRYKRVMKTKEKLYQKGFESDLITHAIEEVESDEE
ncbi:regulatory protein [Pilibacter termitis]|uniref:Regulatory protein RecX n=1 Tax=Pilibacter termitis TaxID=263852 RepID=A0A1T4M0P6_9ENTE|nr:recombination regulator RecX [Pilibacter termitis]SJZ60465.1 regulatory protein [Pilibacter termitis]